MVSLEDVLNRWFTKDYSSLDNSIDELVSKLEKKPLEQLTAITIRIFNNLRKGDFKQITLDFNIIGSPDDPKWLYETYPNKYKHSSGDCMASFGLRAIYAYFPHLIGSTYTAIDRLHSLLRSCINQFNLGNDENIERRILLIGLILSDCLSQCYRPEDGIRVLNSIMSHVPKTWTKQIQNKISHSYTALGGSKLESKSQCDYNKAICMILQGKHDDSIDFAQGTCLSTNVDTFVRKNLSVFQLIFAKNEMRDVFELDEWFTNL